ncbi:hypothetical protein [Cypionkella psychrotolerans]|uniref:hypothetical protein n=1 Tax=Cypionkella psychrotolerans TaxID=1678131 RepID=UPI000A655517|nr:hypothetical protein [Cypionkella psychrotolerans]
MAVDMKRRLARGVAVIAIALGAGQLVQSMSGKAPPPHAAENQTTKKPKAIERVAATEVGDKPAPMVALEAPANTQAEPPKAKAPVMASTTAPVATPEPVAKAAPVVPKTPAAPIAATVPAPKLEITAKPELADACPVSLELSNADNALIAVTLVAPCHADERVVLKHAGLTVTAKTTLTGALFADMPALMQDAKVEVMFKDNTSVAASVAVPELAGLRRFAVQWQQDDAFQLHGFEDGSDFGGPGDVSAATPHQPIAGAPAKGGFLTLLGDASTDLPMLAQVYTYPKDSQIKPEIVVEAAVTEATCGRELLGQTLQTAPGTVKVSDMSLAMPDCDAVGDYLVLKNLVPDMTIASSN